MPPEIKTLAETFVTALKSGDDAALNACWHSAEVLGKAKAEAAVKAAGTSPEPVDSAKEQEREVRKQTKNLSANLERINKVRALVSKHFGDRAQLKFVSVELDEDEDAPADDPAYDDAEIHLLASDATQLRISMDDIVKINGVWKFKGRIDNDLTIELPE